MPTTDIRVIINNEAIDLYDNDRQREALLLDRKLVLEDFSRFEGEASSVPHKIPATKRNKEILGRAGMLREDSSITGDLGSVQIQLSRVTVRQGQAALFQITKSRDNGRLIEPKEYELVYILTNIETWKTLANEFLYEVDFGEIQHTLANIEDGMQYTAASNDWAYGIAKFGKWQGSSTTEVGVQDFMPALFIRNMLEKCFDNVGGFKYDIVSTLFNLNSTEERPELTNRLVFPLTGLEYAKENATLLTNVKASELDVVRYSQTGAFIYIDQLIDSSPNGFDIGNEYDPSNDGRFVARIAGSYEFTFTAEAGFVTDPSSGEIYFAKNFTRVNTAIHPNSDDTFAALLPLTNSINITMRIFLEVGDIITIQAETDDGTGFTVDFDMNNAVYFITPLQVYANRLNSRVVFSKLLSQDWTKLDLVKGLTHAFNLGWYVDEAKKTVYVDPIDNYIIEYLGVLLPVERKTVKGLYKTINTSRLIDLTKNIEWLDNKRESQFEDYAYADANDPTLSDYEGDGNTRIAQARMEFGNFENRGASFRPNPFFERVLCLQDPRLDTNVQGEVVPICPVFYPTDILTTGDSESPVYTRRVPAMLFHNASLLNQPFLQKYNVNRIALPGDAGPSDQQVATYYVTDYLLPVQNIGAENLLNASVSFADEVREDGTTATGLLASYHLQRLSSLNRGVLLRMYMNLNLTDLATINYIHSVWAMQSELFYILAIEQASLARRKSFRVDALRRINPDSTDLAKVTNFSLKSYFIL